MNNNERKWICWRLIDNWERYEGQEPVHVKKRLDNKFCKKFTVNPIENPQYVVDLLVIAISEQNEDDLDLLLSLFEHFEITSYIDEIIAPLLISPWHHFHDRIAGILEFDKNEKTLDLLFKGATYTCDNLDYESDYCGFNRKCIYALLKIGTDKAIQCIKELTDCENEIIANIAQSIKRKYLDGQGT